MSAPAVRVAVALVFALGAASGCVYWNGMYNAKRAAREAEGLERRGRLAEARDRWQRVIVHAESVSTRHPRSRWADDALLLRGRALVRIGFGSDAVAVLEQAERLAGTPAQRAEALTLLGEANIGLGRFAVARGQLDTALAIPESRVGEQALLFRGRALLALGDVGGAIADFDATGDPRAPFDRATAHLAVRDAPAAASLLEALVGARPYAERWWRGALDTLASLGERERASLIVGRLVERGDLSAGARARLLLDDGSRSLAARDTAAARARLELAVLAAADSSEGWLGGVRLARLAAAAAASAEDLSVLKPRLEEVAAEGGAASREAQPLLRMLVLVTELEADTVAPDAAWYLRAELLRDSVGAVRLAASAFAEMVVRFPGSPWTPKGLLAAIASGHPAAESLGTVLDERYADSPYLRAALGLPSPGPEAEAFRALDDSLGRALGRLALSRAAEGRAPRGEQPELDGDRPRNQRPAAPQAPRPAPTRPDPREPPPEERR